MKAIIIILILFSSYRAQSYWEYLGYSGKDGTFEREGSPNLLTEPYPTDYRRPDPKLEEVVCLCSPKTQVELEHVLNRAFGPKAKEYSAYVAKGLKQTSFSEVGKKAGSILEVHGLTFKDDEKTESAFDAMKKHLGSGHEYAFIRKNKTIYFVHRKSKMPPRAFLQFVRGYEANPELK